MIVKKAIYKGEKEGIEKDQPYLLYLKDFPDPKIGSLHLFMIQKIAPDTGKVIDADVRGIIYESIEEFLIEWDEITTHQEEVQVQ